ncbi:MAG TPA: segregation/condensation protein A [Candidatus Paceibacterota bacterium]|nr:segregation/condensation protein A [Candidatus Paceibacterota bacterium]
MAAYSIKTDVYEGPLEALLDLVEKRKLFINDISLASVTDDFIAYVESLGGGKQEDGTMVSPYPIEETSEFLVIASTLLLIKSRSLLPNLSLTESEAADVEDLEVRLRLLQTFKEAAQVLGSHLKGAGYCYAPLNTRAFRAEPRFSPHSSLTLPGLLEAAWRAISLVPKVEERPQVNVKKVISLEETISRLAERVTAALSTSFREFSGYGTKEKTDVIIGFLALLELVKRGVIIAKQHDHFADITLESEKVSVPNYA